MAVTVVTVHFSVSIVCNKLTFLAKYPNFNIRTKLEIEKYRSHRLIQFPFYTYL